MTPCLSDSVIYDFGIIETGNKSWRIKTRNVGKTDERPYQVAYWHRLLTADEIAELYSGM